MPELSFPTPPQRILIIKPSAIGDVVHTLPILNLLRRHWPAAHISWLVTPACAGLLENHPQLDEVIHFERRRFGQGWWNPRATIGLFEFTRALRRGGFDLVLDLQGLFRSGWLAAKTRSPVRVGFANAREFGWIFYTHRVAVDSVEQHAIERYLKLVDALGVPRSPVEFVFNTTDADRAYVDGLLPREARERGYAVLLPGTNWATKRWPAGNFSALLAPLKERFGLFPVLAGGSGDRALAQEIIGRRDAGGAEVLDLSGRTSLPQLTALLERASLVIANDSGPMHIAAALRRPLVALFGPTNSIRTGPYGRDDAVLRLDIPCSPCYSRRCSHRSCLQQLSVASVLGQAEIQLAANTPKSLLST
ncbi:MAG TPA: lipopolysaccharide heptosyltransferase I [Tepidisphaeraceae bacterium]|jgi:lipopolysaccharide heptosyltransferase I